MQACEVDEAEEVYDVIFPPRDKAAEVVHPGKEPFHFQRRLHRRSVRPSCVSFWRAAVRRDHLDAVIIGKPLIERVGLVSFVADQPGREPVEQAFGKNLFHKLALGWRSALDRYGERTTVISGDSSDLRALAAAGGADGKASCLALAKVASTNASSRSSCNCVSEPWYPPAHVYVMNDLIELNLPPHRAKRP